VPEVGIAGLPLDYRHSGTAVYLKNLLPRLPVAAPDLKFHLFVRRPQEFSGNPTGRILHTPFGQLDQSRPLWARLDKLAWETIALPIASALRGEAIVHFPYLAAPVLSAGSLVVTVHDVIPLVLEGYHRGPASVAYSKLMARTVSRARAIITVSEHSKRDIARVLGISTKKIHVTYEAADACAPSSAHVSSEQPARDYGLPQRYLLYIGGAEKRKNVGTLVRAWALIAQFMRSRDVRLVIVATFPPPDDLYPDVPGLVRDLDLAQDIVIVPEVSAADKPALYRRAIALCFPSMYEGFGLTPLESMAQGTPVLAANATSIPEVVGDAGWLLPPGDPGAWADAMRQIVDSAPAREALRESGLRRAAEFSWEKTANQTVEVYRQVLGG
jgi:glycosyltransferase involved in cell wall biosynthesis